MTTQREEYEALIERAKRIIVEEYDVDKMARAIIAEAASTLGTVTERQLDKGQHVNSEWLNDNAPIGERKYRDPAKAVWSAMLSGSPITPGGETEAQRSPHSFPTAS